MLGASVAVGLVSALFALPHALSAWWLSPDAIEHLAIANAWRHGSGFVDPVQWNYFLQDHFAPLPAFAERAPVVPVLFALAFEFGATVSNISPLHAIWASTIIALTVPAACQFMRLPAATATALLIGLSPGWILLARYPWTECTAFGAYLLILVSARGVMRSASGAILCALATELAWATRPNLEAIAVAVIVAAVWEVGWRRSVRHAGLWIYALALIALHLSIGILVKSITGLAPYAGYAVGEVLRDTDAFHYRMEYLGPLTFVRTHASELLPSMKVGFDILCQKLYGDGTFHHLGWLLLPALPYALASRRAGSFEQRINAFSALGLSVVVVAVGLQSFDANRYPLFGATGAALCGMAMIDDLALLAGEYFRGILGRATVTLFALLPLVGAVLLICFTTASQSLQDSRAAWQSYQQRGTVEFIDWGLNGSTQQFCRHMDRDAIVAGANPWSYTFWCGNAALFLPIDLGTVEWQQRFIRERHPRYFISDGGYFYYWLQHSKLLTEVARFDRFTLYKVRGHGSETDPWQAPPPVACAGKDSDCTEQLGR